MKKTDKTKGICCGWLNVPNRHMAFIMGLFLASGMLFSWQPVNAQCTNSPTVPVGIQPVEVPGNPSLCSGGARFNNPVSTTYNLGGVGTVTVVVSNDPSCGEVFSWEVSPGIEIDNIIVKGGPNANSYDYTGVSPRPTFDGFLHSPVGPSGDFYGLSHIDFCYRFVPPPVECELVVDHHVICKGEEDGEMTLSWTGGVGPFSVYLNGELKSSNATSPYQFTDLTAGSYEAKVVDSLDSESICDAEITEPESELTADWEGQILCFGESAEINITVAGGVAPYTLEGTDEVIPPSEDGILSLSLGAGSTSLTIIDNNGCEVPLEIELEEPPLLEAEFEGEILCHGDGIDVTITATGGTPPFTLFEGAVELGEFTDDTFVILGVGAGSYSYTVVDANECEAFLDFELEEPDELLLTLTPTDLDCYGDGSGEISASWVGGTGPFDIYLDNVLVMADVVSPYVFSNLDAGTFNVEVMDANGCAVDDDVTVSQPDELLLTLTPTDLDCYGDGSGEISASWVGGTGPFDIYLDGMLHEADVTSPFVFLGLDADDYNVEVMDANGCAADDDVTISQPDELLLTLTPTDLDCYGDGSGEISASWVGGTGPFDIYLDNVLFMSDVVSPYVFSNLDAGTFNVEVMDANGCAVDDDVTISQSDELLLTLTPTDLDCYGDGSGEISASWVGGTGPFDIYLDGMLHEADVTSPFVFLGLDADDYNVEVMDANGCAVDDDVTVSQPDELIADFEADEILCYGDVVDVTVKVTGGTEPIKLFDGAIEVGTFVAGEFVVEDVPAGSYSWTVVDANGCEDLVEFTLEEPLLLECTVELVKTADCEIANGSATVVPTGGVEPYTFLWDNGETTATAVELGPGLHSVLVTDANGCETTCEIYIEEEPCVVECETAYGRLDGANTCFIQDGFGNWGWTNLIEEEGEYSMDLFAAAGQCDTSKGMLVGSVEVVYANGELSVTYLITEPGISMSEIHTYVGCGKYPKLRNGRETIAPGQYTHNAGLNKAVEYTVTFTNVSGPVYVIAHAVVCTISGTEVVMTTNNTAISCGVQIVSQPAQGRGGPGKSDTIGYDEQSGIRAEVFPNPFRGQATISFGVDRDTRAVVEVYTLQGSRVATLFDAQVKAEDNQMVNFSADSQTGHQVYLVVIRTDYGRITKQVISY
jgi:hypothetical protein